MSSDQQFGHPEVPTEYGGGMFINGGVNDSRAEQIEVFFNK